MKNRDDARGGIRPDLDAKQCELLIGLACKTEKPSSAGGAVNPPRPGPSQEATGTRTHRDSLAQAMIGLILGPDAF
jgi:hypothetical protein